MSDTDKVLRSTQDVIKLVTLKSTIYNLLRTKSIAADELLYAILPGLRQRQPTEDDTRDISLIIMALDELHEEDLLSFDFGYKDGLSTVPMLTAIAVPERRSLVD
ncbi:MAG: hypothetical protein A3B99_00265 [Candidatus Yanofskybacteria bacterium RIFCSPHIGHO2_02_FULL_44_12b]|uniref:Uncharacterized protein n=2 Tax=Candidatus Yanofskyibacteriota TaxID=1752733 RepID=A0A1F8GKQ3_9BACT|nr:MAG: hypothetical protein UW79_C0006G0019 [Candidatus Yanofskybacteria bacterium GW2011_GWA2_44_9]OGN04185.1 MAG: hypothetical protein A2659_01710 [Candidatus Yanofskybacteria bacterium RIFCSPHIGHO2_01_FULL_44_24]OGN14779.1 MAG: hypothetical protein A3B99_00265 [Candidatus Yanofskybacteria bacterium RIFCSPHIGHO2_02_FULL_44_12b]OGN25911.1 MAG: hypothetical protein A2925_02630 [Candidatus Yanofskybacteria bacterium RIFCSPLOWO2_01_FULL_44_22]